MLGVIRGIDGFGIWNPGDIRLSLVCNERLVVRGDVPKYGLEPGIVHHDVAPVTILQFHANVLPDLYRDCAVREVLIKLIDGALLKVWPGDPKGIEGGTQRGMAVRRMDESECCCALT